MKTKHLLLALVCGVGMFGSAAAFAAEPLKIGLVVPMSGGFANYGTQIEHGIQLYLKEHNGRIDGREVKLIIKDTTGVDPARSKRLARDLVLKDHVNILAGFALSPNAFAATSIATQAKVPMIIMNAAASNLTLKSPYALRTSLTEKQAAAPMGIWAAKNGIKTVYVAVADFSPGIDSGDQFTKTFEANGGKVIGTVKVPLSNSDPSPYLQRIKDAKPDAVYAFFTPGQQSISFVQGFQKLGLKKAGIKLIGTSLTEEGALNATGNAAIGTISALNWSEAHPSKENKEYVSAYQKSWPKVRPTYMSVAAFDGMQLTGLVLKKDGEKTDGPSFAKAAEGMSWTSPRGPVSIDPATRDIVQNIYIRKVEKVNGTLENVEFDVLKDRKDPTEK